MKNFKTIIKYASTLVAVLIITLAVTPQEAMAGSSSNGVNGVNTGGYSLVSSPVYSYTPYSSPSSNYSLTSSPVYSYTPYSTPSYNYTTPSYSYTPAPTYSYVPTGSGRNTGGSSAPQMQYVYSSNKSSNKNTNTNTNNNNVTNTFNPVNNNDARINLIVYGGGGSTTPEPTPALNGSCTINPSVAYINQDVSFSASASGGNGSYSYSWTGDNGLNSAAQSFTGRFGYSGYKTATVTIRSGSETITRTCGINIQDTNVVSGAYCVANPTNAGINQNVTWTVYPNNTNGYVGNYSYSWTGTDGLFGNSQSISRTYNTPGYKTATVTMTGNGQSFTTTCNTNINGVLASQSNVTVIRDQGTNLGTPVSGVFLSQVPATGIGFGFKMTLFSVGLVLWSLFAAYMISRKKNGALAHRINAFKLANMQKKGIIG